MRLRRVATLLASVLISSSAAPSVQRPVITRKTRNVIVVTTDGLRWQEVFGGADPDLLNKATRLHRDWRSKEKALDAERGYGQSDIAKRRSALMPFLWSTMATEGQIYGNHAEGSDVVVTNGVNVSYPGYSELLTGVVDPHIVTNDKIPNPNVTVMEWLQHRPGFEGKVAAFGAWDAFTAIFNSSRCGFPVNSGYEQFNLLPSNPTIASLNKMKAQSPRVWEDEPFDALPFYTSLEYIKAKKPRVAFIGLGETDDWAHEGNYPEYLNAAHRADQFVAQLWELLESMPEYRNSTTILFTTDHGRGDGASWSNHGADLPESRQTWFAALGPDTAALGERRSSAEVRQNQIASTISSLLGQDFTSASPNAGKPIDDLLMRAPSDGTGSRGSRYPNSAPRLQSCIPFCTPLVAPTNAKQ